jgi:hypothetical protein
VKVKRTYTCFIGEFIMISTKTKPKIRNMLLLALISTTFILSIVSYSIPPLQLQQAFGQGAFQTEDDQSPPQLILEEANNETADQTNSTTITENNQRITLGDITIPITSDTHLSLELPDSNIIVEPNK